MSRSIFFYSLVGITVLTALFVFFMTSLPTFQADTGVLWISFAAFALLSLLMYFLGHKAVSSKNKNNFISVILVSTVVKMFMAILIIFVYIRVYLPESRLFVLPFLGIYLIYTVYETYFMMKLAKMKTNDE